MEKGILHIFQANFQSIHAVGRQNLILGFSKLDCFQLSQFLHAWELIFQPSHEARKITSKHTFLRCLLSEKNYGNHLPREVLLGCFKECWVRLRLLSSTTVSEVMSWKNLPLMKKMMCIVKLFFSWLGFLILNHDDILCKLRSVPVSTDDKGT